MSASDPPTGDGEATQYCWDCGEPVAPEMEYCSSCGANLGGPTETDRSRSDDGNDTTAVIPTSTWYPYVFVGLAVAIVGFFALAATGSTPGGSSSPGGAVAASLVWVGLGTVAVAVFKDATHVGRHAAWSPRRWVWTAGSVVGVVNVLVLAIYARRRADRTGQSWLPGNPLRSATDDPVDLGLPRVSLTLSVFLLYNWILWFAAPDVGSVLVSLVSMWEVTGTSVFGGATTYTITGYSPVGGVVSLLAAYGLVWFAVTTYGG